MKAKYSATLEFDVEAPLTIKGETEAPSLQSLYRNAAKELKTAFPNRVWQSCVIVLERL